jgi:hypothetical protein
MAPTRPFKQTRHAPFISVDEFEGRTGPPQHTPAWACVCDLPHAGALLTNLSFWQPEPEACMPYSAKFGNGTLDKYIVAGGSGKRPCVKVYQQVGPGGWGTRPQCGGVWGCGGVVALGFAVC